MPATENGSPDPEAKSDMYRLLLGEASEALSPAKSLTSCDPSVSVSIRSNQSEVRFPFSPPTRTIPAVFREVSEKYSDRCAMRVHDGDETLVEFCKYGGYWSQARKAAQSLLALGLDRWHGVGLMGFNSPEWFLANFGAIMAGGLSVGIYTTNSAEICQYVCSDSRCQVVFVDEPKHRERILEALPNLPQLRAVVRYGVDTDDSPVNSVDVSGEKCRLLTWREFIALGDAEEFETLLNRRMSSQHPNDCCSLIYTSGTTGAPKAAMLSHDNLLFTAIASCRTIGLVVTPQETFVSYLPLSHIAAQIVDIYALMLVGGEIVFARRNALKAQGSLAASLKAARPTAFLGVPRVWEKIMEAMQERGQEVSASKRRIAQWAKKHGLKGNMRKLEGKQPSCSYRIARRLVFGPVRAALGFDRLHVIVCGAAPLRAETLDYFLSLDLPICETFGMSELTGPHTVNRFPDRMRVHSAGLPLPGSKSRLVSAPEAGERQELLAYGRNVFMGYMWQEEKTSETIDADGWLHTGDLAEIDDDGFLFITGRLKEIIITAGGENIAPLPIEDALKFECPLLSQAIVIGDRRKFLVVLVTLGCVIDTESGAPTDSLSTNAQNYIVEQANINISTVGEAHHNQDVRRLIQEALDRVNDKAKSHAQRVQKFEILPVDFSVAGGELGPTTKMRRPFITEMYLDVIERLYRPD